MGPSRRRRRRRRTTTTRRRRRPKGKHTEEPKPNITAILSLSLQVESSHLVVKLTTI
jgi:hypothetical protein